MLTLTVTTVATAIIIGIVLIAILSALFFRVVVTTNNVEIVQSSKKTISYGKDQPAGNTYYRWPSWIPVFGVKTISLPVSVFDVKLSGYAGYDKGRVPFVIDIMAFFRITDSNIAAQRIASFEELQQQLQSILQGAVRTILASNEIEQILEGRAEFGDRFTKEVDHQLINWGVQSVKCIELMDIRDASDSKVISNIMEKKKSLIEMQSRTEVANNRRTAEIAEVQAAREVAVQKQEAEQQVGVRTAEKEKEIGIAKELSSQTIKEQAKITADKDMEIERVKQIKAAEIQKDAFIVAAEQKKREQIIAAEAKQSEIQTLAEAQKQHSILVAEGNLATALKNAQGLEAEGMARAKAEEAMQMAPVTAQTSLAKEIGANNGYQTYLVQIRTVEANEKIGTEQAKALQHAEIKVIANSNDAASGVNSIGELISSKGGVQFGAMLEGFLQSDNGKEIVSKFLKSEDKKK